MAIASHDVHDDHGHGAHGHDDHDDHGHGDGHHGAGGDSWVLVPLLVGLVIGIVVLAVLGLDSGAAPSVH